MPSVCTTQLRKPLDVSATTGGLAEPSRSFGCSHPHGAFRKAGRRETAAARLTSCHAFRRPDSAQLLKYAQRVSWQRMALGAVGVLTLLVRGIIVTIFVRLKRKERDRWSGANRLLLATVIGPYVAFGAACVAVAIWPRSLPLLCVAAVVLILQWPLRRWLARRFDEGS